MGRDPLKVEHFSAEFFIWKETKEMHGEQRLQKRGPALFPTQALGWKEGVLPCLTCPFASALQALDATRA